jgi:hypothetical protein
MKQLNRHPEWRRWANIAVMIAGAWVLMIVLWSPEAAGPREQQIEVADSTIWFAALTAAGSLAIAAVIVALKNAVIARVLLGIAALSLLAGIIGFQQLGTLAWGTVVIPGIIMLLAIPFLGPLPTPEDEGQVRHGIGHVGQRDALDPERRGGQGPGRPTS